MLQNTRDRYGLVAVVLHWAVALVVVGLFALGLWMVDLGYYDEWRQTAPALHKAIGVLLFLAVLLRLLWRQVQPRPAALPSHAAWERLAAGVAHAALYLLLFGVMVSGYLISTADGRPIDVFGLFAVPATLTGLPGQADIAGKVHLALAVALVSTAGLHALAALKHHLLDRDATLIRMLGIPPRTEPARPKAARQSHHR